MFDSITRFETLFENSSLTLECGKSINNVRVAFQTYGTLNDAGDNCIVVCHALTGNAHAAGISTKAEIARAYDEQAPFLAKYHEMNLGKFGWWDSLIGEDKLFDTNKYFIVCSTLLGSCYGTYSEDCMESRDGFTSKLFKYDLTVRDLVRVQKGLTDLLNVKHIHAVVGGSLGGMQVLEWGILFGDMISYLFPIATTARHSDWAIAFGEVERNAITNDPDWNAGWYNQQPRAGLALARKIAMISYRTGISFNQKFSRKKLGGVRSDSFNVENYLSYQGEKLVDRFDANAYINLTRIMDRHDVAADRGTIEEVLGKVKCKVVSIGISSDLLYPTEDQKLLAKLIPQAEYKEIESAQGHDAFLIEFDQIIEILSPYL